MTPFRLVTANPYKKPATWSLAILCGLVLCGFACTSQRAPERERESLRRVMAKLDDYRTKHFGPANFKAYQSVLGDRILTSGPAIVGNPNAYNSKAAPAKTFYPVSPAAIAHMPEIRDALLAYYKQTESKWHTLAEAIQGGGYYQSLTQQEPLWPDPALILEPDYQATLVFARDNLMKGLLLLATGEPKRAIDAFAMGVKLGEGLFGKDLLSGWLGAQAIQISCNGYNQLLWQAMDAEIARYALDSCRGLHLPIEQHKFAAMCDEIVRFADVWDVGERRTRGIANVLSPNPVVMRLLSPWPFVSVGYLPGRLQGVGLTRSENQRWLQRITKKGIWPPYQAKLTTLPALRKRLRHILATEPYFRKKPYLLDEADLRELSPELQVLLRFPVALDAPHMFWTPTYMGATRLELVRAALGSRIFRAEKGRWPNDIAELQAADLITTPVVPFPGSVTIVDLYAKYKDQPLAVDYFLISVIAGSLLPAYADTYPGARGATFFTLEYTSTTFTLTLRAVPEECLEATEYSLKGFTPLVGKVRRVLAVPESHPVQEFKDGRFPYPRPGSPLYREARFEAEFKRPRHFGWAYSWGPDGKDDGGIISYDPTNGMISPGDIGQIVGWK